MENNELTLKKWKKYSLISIAVIIIPLIMAIIFRGNSFVILFFVICCLGLVALVGCILGYVVAYKKIKGKMPMFVIILLAIGLALGIMALCSNISDNDREKNSTIYAAMYEYDPKMNATLELQVETDTVLRYKATAKDSYTRSKYGEIFYIMYNTDLNKILNTSNM